MNQIVIYILLINILWIDSNKKIELMVGYLGNFVQDSLSANAKSSIPTASERSGAVAGNSSSDSLNFDTKERLSRHPFGVQNLDAKILQNTESTKNKLSKIKNDVILQYSVKFYNYLQNIDLIT